MAWPTDLTKLLKRISTPAEEVFKGLRVLGDYNQTILNTHEAAIKAYLRLLGRNHNVFVVNITSGNDTTGVGTLTSPYRTIKKALVQCTANRDDIILVERDTWHSGDTATEDWPIVVNKNKVHIIGMGNPRLPKVPLYPTNVGGTAVDEAAFQLTSVGQYTEIANFILSAGSSHGCIEMGNEGQVDGVYIHDCEFGNQLAHVKTGGASLTPLNGILHPADSTRGGMYSTRIERCRFLGDGANNYGKISGNAMDFLSGAGHWFYDLQILDCIFKGCAIGINTINARGAEILGNKFICADSADGEAITLSVDCVGGLISGNEAMEGTSGMTKNPYKDLGTNHWGLNYRQGVSILPVTV